jgi:hypothetical protein
MTEISKSIILKRSVKSKKFDVVLIDEIQDYMQSWIDIITSYFTHNETEFVEVSSFTIEGTSIYTKLSNGSIIETDKYDEDGLFSGSKGSTLVYTKDDIKSSQINSVSIN